MVLIINHDKNDFKCFSGIFKYCANVVIFCNGHYDFVFNVQIKFLTKNLFV